MRNATDDELNQFKPQGFSDEELQAIAKQMRLDIDKMVEDIFLGKDISTASSTEPTSLSLDSLQEALELLAKPKPRKWRGFDLNKPIRIFVDHNCYKRKIEVYGIADQHKPNQKKMLYRKRTVIIPLIIRVGNDIVCHPSMEAKIRAQFSMEEQSPFTARDFNFLLGWQGSLFGPKIY